jgi:hypothetical protein
MCLGQWPSAAEPRPEGDTLPHEKTLRLTIVTDLDALANNRRHDAYQPATVFFEDAKGRLHEVPAEVKPRGKYRRKVCDFPPVKIKFPKKEVHRLGLGKENSLKLVTHCMNDSDSSRTNVLREYLAYKIYNELTDMSFHVRLVQVTYRDVNSQLPETTRLGFFIEDVDDLAQRLNGKEHENMNLPLDSIAQQEAQMVAVFQYMIGNADWDFSTPRNLKYIAPTNGGKWLPIPYDFDFSGLVDAPYARPNTNYGLLTVKERIYLGHWATEADLGTTLSLFLQKKERILALVKKFKNLSKAERNDVVEYLEDFYNNLVNLTGL